jgi:hypothetical protein
MPVVLENLRTIAPQLVRAQQQLREIHHAGALALRLVFLVDLDELRAGRIAGILQCARTEAFIFIVVDEPLDFARHPAGVIELHRFHDLLDEAQLILAIEDLEALRQVGVAPVQAQQAMRDAVERAHPHRAARDA